MTQTKDTLAAYVAQETGLTKRESKDAINAFLTGIIEANKQNERVQLIGFGSFSVMTHPEHDGTNPMTHEKIRIPKIAIPKFRPGTAYRTAIAENNK